MPWPHVSEPAWLTNWSSISISNHDSVSLVYPCNPMQMLWTLILPIGGLQRLQTPAGLGAVREPPRAFQTTSMTKTGEYNMSPWDFSQDPRDLPDADSDILALMFTQIHFLFDLHWVYDLHNTNTNNVNTYTHTHIHRILSRTCPLDFSLISSSCLSFTAINSNPPPDYFS